MFKYFAIITFFLTFNLSAEIVQKLEVRGNSRVSDETIKVYGEIKLNEDYSNIDINNILKNLYKTDFFEDIQISLDSGVLNITVKEYASINSISLVGEKSTTIKKKVLEQLKLQQKESFIESKLTEDINGIKKIYASMGFNFATVEAKIKNFSDNRINLIFFLEKEKKTDIAKIYFTGDKKLKTKRLLDIIVSEEKKFWKILSKNTYLSYANIELDKRLLINYYKSLGFYDVQVLSSNAEVSKENLTTLTYTINAGTRYKIYKISTNVSDVLNKKLFLPLEKKFKKVVGKYYSPFTVKKLLDEVDLLISTNDLQFIEHSVNEILEGDNIEVKINIYEGEKLSVEKINIIGNSVTDESVIRAELLIDEGDPFNKLKLDKSIAKIKSRNLFSKVKEKTKNGTEKNQKIIDIEVEEKPTGEISAGAGIGTEGGSFAFSVTENNWLGRGINVASSINVSKTTLTGNIEVTDPNYNYSGNSLSYFLSNTTNDKADSGFKNKLTTIGIGTSFEQYRNVYLSPKISYAYDDLVVNSTASKSLKKQAGSFQDLSFDYGILLDNRDRVYAPTEGNLTRFSQALPIYADSPYLKNTFAFTQYKTFNPDAVGKLKFHASAINGLNDEDVRLNKRVSLSSNRLRGFEAGKVGPKDGKDYVGGNYALATNFELNLPNLLPEATKTDVGLFLDFGNVWAVDYDKQLDDSNKVRSSVGVNTSWLSPVGPMTFVFSQNLAKANTDVTETFNFKLGTTF